VDLIGSAPEPILKRCAIGHQAPGLGELTKAIDGRQLVSQAQFSQLFAMLICEAARRNIHRIALPIDHLLECQFEILWRSDRISYDLHSELTTLGRQLSELRFECIRLTIENCDALTLGQHALEKTEALAPEVR